MTTSGATAAGRDRSAEAELNLYAYHEQTSVPRFPLAVVSPPSDKTINSVWGSWSVARRACSSTTRTAASRGIHDGDGVRVFNDLAGVDCQAAVDARVRPGVVRPGGVSLPKGYWRRSFANGLTSTALVPDTLSEVGQGACFNDARVDVALR